MNLAVDYPWVLLALLMSLFPLFNNGVTQVPYPSIEIIPNDGLSSFISVLIKLIAVAAITFLVLALAGLNRGEQSRERIGYGAHIVLLLDRSKSMDYTYAGKAPDGSEESKASAAKRLLSEFIKQRKHDRIGVAGYSTSALFFMPLTENKQAALAAVSATDLPALAYTNISKGLAMGLSYFQQQSSQTGSRIILLVSDGAAVIDPDSEAKIRRWAKQLNIRLYWIFMRSENSPGLYEKPEDPRDDNAGAMPERYLHLFFTSLGIPYKAYQAENPDAVQEAINDINQLENMPLHYVEKIPKQDLSNQCYQLAMLFISLLWIFKLAEARP
ncbi:MoxR-like ATPases [methanotrophic endosymbiont of Bathymodiolus puteoserpentis (Logatchev)]|jgi:mxaC protein|nr:vWA domain-containing protein [methanotrophic endosymbiont of Bathymodiolus puteoserpentis (Logatchev)]SHE22761.1 MoxR-like ATPases [methanotrophic endosymbiont of Bathymodiolus puteoserpentis (Logatchev)]